MKWLIALPSDLMRAGMLVIAFGCTVLGILAWAAWLTPTLDFVANLAPIALAAAVLAGLVWLAWPPPRRPLGTGPLALIAVILWGGLVVPDVATRLLSRPAAVQGETIKVVQFNLWADDWDNTARKLAWIRSEKPDVLMLEEVADAGYPLLAALTKDYPYKVTCQGGPYPCPVVVMSRRQPIAVGHWNGDKTYPNIAWARFQGAGGEFTVAATHIDWPLPDGRQPRLMQGLAGKLKSLKSDSLILGGDFNATPWSFPLQRLDRDSGLARRSHALPTWPAGQVTKLRWRWPLPLLPIDHLFASQDWRVASLRRGPDLGSDHFPIVAVLVRDAPAAAARTTPPK
jgi:endonuclease/exonuclease/phosphatase (EEP) superfamily protein YafD